MWFVKHNIFEECHGSDTDSWLNWIKEKYTRSSFALLKDIVQYYYLQFGHILYKLEQILDTLGSWNMFMGVF